MSLVVESSGPVLDQRQVADLAQPFRRLGADLAGTGRGSGLGLSIVAAVTRAHHGILDLRARPRRRLRATVTLPRTDTAGRRRRPPAHRRSWRVESPGGRGRPPLAEVIAEELRDQSMAVDLAHDVLDAVAKPDVNPYDVVVLDRDLPGIHGHTLCQVITERDGRVRVEPIGWTLAAAASCRSPGEGRHRCRCGRRCAGWWSAEAGTMPGGRNRASPSRVLLRRHRHRNGGRWTARTKAEGCERGRRSGVSTDGGPGVAGRRSGDGRGGRPRRMCRGGRRPGVRGTCFVRFGLGPRGGSRDSARHRWPGGATPPAATA
ncbi:response regulator [Streptomyces sp. NPDC018031]|uniref:response regulator n=1 Tax=Streptomyces sp. NPDC018031 TaxID=3365033 RepID=UPI003788A57A